MLKIRSWRAAIISPVMALLTACGDERSDDTPAPQPSSVLSTSKSVSDQHEEQAEISPEDALLKRGRIVFLQCRSCHTLKDGEPHLVGPNLYGVMGAPSGGKDGFAYSDALANGAVTWTDDALHAFLKKPAELAPGTRMFFVGLREESDQDAVIAYLKQETQPAPKPE